MPDGPKISVFVFLLLSLKGSDSRAQGEALGEKAIRVRALKGRNRAVLTRFLYRPYRAWLVVGT
jgi:hypothetical protein